MDRTTAVSRAMSEHGLSRENTHSAKISATRPVWWIDVPLKKVEPGGVDEIHLLLFDQRSDELHHLRVPSAYFIENLDRLDVRADTGRVSLQLAIDSPVMFENTRPIGSGVSFAQFLS